MYQTHGHELNFVHRRVLGAIGGFVTGGPPGAAAGFFGGGGGGNGGAVTSPGGPSSAFGPNVGNTCNPPYTRHPTTGRCTLDRADTGVGTEVGTRPTEGWRARLERFFPGGETGTEVATEGYGDAVIGAFGIPALEPAIVGAVQRRDGTMAPIRRCPPGLVLATDELCYAKGTKGLAAHRKWKPSGACFLPPRDVKALRRAVAIRKSKSNRAMFRELGLG